MNKNEYVKLKEVIENNSNDSLKNEEKKDIYQIQAKKDQKNAYIVKVGRFNKTPTVIINRFDYNSDYHCLLLSCFYDKNLFLNSDLKLNMFKLLINIKKLSKLYPIGCLTTTINIKERDKNRIEGSYSINFYFDDIEMNLENFDKFIGFEILVEKMIKYLDSQKIKNVMENKLKGI